MGILVQFVILLINNIMYVFSFIILLYRFCHSIVR